MTARVDLENFTEILNDIIDDQLGGLSDVLKDSLPGAAKIMIRHAKQVTLDKDIYDPEDKGIHYADSWGFITKDEHPGQVYVGNTKKVKRKKSDSTPEIPLINIVEYGTKKGVRPRPHTQDIVASSSDEILDYVTKEIESRLK